MGLFLLDLKPRLLTHGSTTWFTICLDGVIHGLYSLGAEKSDEPGLKTGSRKTRSDWEKTRSWKNISRKKLKKKKNRSVHRKKNLRRAHQNNTKISIQLQKQKSSMITIPSSQLQHLQISQIKKYILNSPTLIEIVIFNRFFLKYNYS